MEKLSYSAHISNKKSAINSKAKLAGVAKHNLRKYHSSDYSDENIKLIYGTDNLMQDVKRVYKEQFGEAVKEYNKKQTRSDRKIKNYFNEVSEKSQDIAVEIIFQIGDKKFWEENRGEEQLRDIHVVYKMLLEKLMELMPDFVVANAVVHYDEASPHMHVVGVPVGRGFKRGLATKVSKRSVFTQETLANVLQGELRELAEWSADWVFHTKLKEKQKGKNHDLSVVEYKVAKEKEKYSKLKEKIDKQEEELERLEEKESEMLKKAQLAEKLYDVMIKMGMDDDYLRERYVDVMYENQQLREENSRLQEMLDKALDFMKQFVVDGRSVLDRFKEKVGWVTEKIVDRVRDERKR